MALTAEDVTNIRQLLEDVITRRVDPRFERLEEKFEGRFAVIEKRLDALGDDMKLLREDMAVVKDTVKDHGFEITRLKRRTA